MRRWLHSWTPALRIARRDALRARGRSILVVVMIALPVAAVVSLDVIGRTADVSVVEGLDRQLGQSDALVTYRATNGAVDQSPTMDGTSEAATVDGAAPATFPTPTARTIAGVLPRGARVVEVREGTVALHTRAGVSRPTGVELDLRRHITAGLYHLTSGRYPSTSDELLVSSRLARRGFTPGALVDFADGRRAAVVGLVESAVTTDTNLVVGLPGALPLEAQPKPAPRSWLVESPGGLSWAQVQSLNAHGLYALSRDVIENPPPPSQVSSQFTGPGGGGVSGAAAAVLAMIVAMALLEVVLLAGPAFAVGVKRMERSLALMAATGAEPPDIRKVVLASGVVLGAFAGAAGLAVGVVGSWAALPLVQTFSSERFGPFELVPRDLLGIAACGLFSAVLAALVPAVMASRQDVVAVLAGRRGETRTPVWSPVLGAVLLGLGIAGAVVGARKAGGEFFIAGAAVASVLGMVLLIPLVVAQLGRFARVLPLPLRFAVRDAARQRARTAPAVAAVAAVVAGVVALGVGGTSDAAQNRATYSPTAPTGDALVSWYARPADQARLGGWDAMAAAVSRQLPGATVHRMLGVPDEIVTGARGEGSFRSPGNVVETGTRSLVVGEQNTGGPGTSVSYGSNFGAALLVGARTLTDSGVQLSPGDRRRARTVLARGGIVLFGYRSTGISTEVIHLQEFSNDGNGDPKDLARWTFPATTVQVDGNLLPARGVLSAAAARTTGVPTETTSLLLSGSTIDQAAEDRANEAVQQIDANASLYVERGFHDNSVAVALLILGVAGGVLVLGGTLTATFLALSDARPDFATMGAVGAGPRTRRLVAAAYALTVGAVGAALGAAVGFVPGIAVTYPLTRADVSGATGTDGSPLPAHFLDVPWLLIIGLVIGLPLFASLVVAAATRSRLPMVSRLS